MTRYLCIRRLCWLQLQLAWHLLDLEQKRKNGEETESMLFTFFQRLTNKGVDYLQNYEKLVEEIIKLNNHYN